MTARIEEQRQPAAEPTTTRPTPRTEEIDLDAFQAAHPGLFSVTRATE